MFDSLGILILGPSDKMFEIKKLKVLDPFFSKEYKEFIRLPIFDKTIFDSLDILILGSSDKLSIAKQLLPPGTRQ